MTPPTTASDWTLVIPVKAANRAKQRLALPPAKRAAHAHAFAVDTVSAALACPQVGSVVVVTDDPGLGRHLAAQGAQLLQASLGLNAAVRAGASDAPGPVAAMPADLPSLTAGVLDDALAAARAFRRAVVADRHGRGTVLLTDLEGALDAPAFGPHSFDAHQQAGYTPLDGSSWPGLRLDVDTMEDLGAAVRLGVGRATAALHQR